MSGLTHARTHRATHKHMWLYTDTHAGYAAETDSSHIWLGQPRRLFWHGARSGTGRREAKTNVRTRWHTCMHGAERGTTHACASVRLKEDERSGADWTESELFVWTFFFALTDVHLFKSQLVEDAGLSHLLPGRIIRRPEGRKKKKKKPAAASVVVLPHDTQTPGRQVSPHFPLKHWTFDNAQLFQSSEL